MTLLKASLTVTKDDTAEARTVQFQYNPEFIDIEYTQASLWTKTMGKGQSSPNGVVTEREPARITLSDVTFDTWETRENVFQKYIGSLQAMAAVDRKKTAPPTLLFTWGQFTNTQVGPARMVCKLESIKLRYTMFLDDGTPVRAKANLVLRLETQTVDAPTSHGSRPVGPSHNTHQVVTQRGDTLSGLAHRIYGDAGAWRRIADANDIDDPLSLCPGQRLMVPGL